jgi:GR25 family glycosyltransferase involved in LPS biosynthesis
MRASWEDLDIDFHIINMKKSERRRSRMEQRLSERGIRHRFVDAIDGDDAPIVQASFTCNSGSKQRIYDPERKENPIRNSELACTLSHMLAIRDAHAMGLRRVIMCEDDIEIGDVEAGEIGAILAAIPADAAYVQLCVLGPEVVHGLAQYYIEAGQSFAQKVIDPPTAFVDKALAHLGCYSTGAYIITAAGMQNACERFFDGSRVIFPCNEDEVRSNIRLIADRFVYQAAASERYPGYVCCVPTFLMEGEDSTLHPQYVEEHRECRSAAELWRKRIMAEHSFSSPWYATTYHERAKIMHPINKGSWESAMVAGQSQDEGASGLACREVNGQRIAELALALESAKTDNEALRAECSILQSALAQTISERDTVAATSKRWFEAVIAVTTDHNPVPRALRKQLSWWRECVNHLIPGYSRPSPITLATCARDAGKWELAVRYYRDALDVEPRNPDVWMQCGHALKNAEKSSEAEIAYQISRELTSRGPT